MAHCPTKMHIRPIDAACSVDRNPTSLRQRPLGMLTTQPADHGASDSTSQPRRIRGEPERAEHTRHSPPAVHPPLSSPGTRQSQQNFPHDLPGAAVGKKCLTDVDDGGEEARR
jgi:hypothetical protein